MAYKIDYLDAKGLIGTDRCDGTLLRAEAIARKAIATRMADQVEIRDDGGAVVFRLARTLFVT